MILKKYQQNAVKELLIASKKILAKNKKSASLVFKSPTGSGKTVIMQEFLRDFTENTFDEKYAFLWISVNDLSAQSKKSFERNLAGSKLIFSELSDVKNQILQENEVLFINWEKIRTIDNKTWEWKVLAMKDNETGENLPNYLENTHNANIKIILIVDESHRSLDTQRAQELIQNYIKPALQIEVSATPDSADYDEKIEVDITDVIEEWMIKKEVLINPELKDSYKNEKNIDIDEFILAKAIEKQELLQNIYNEKNTNIKPLLLVQLPSEAKATSELDRTKLKRTIEILNAKFNKNFENKKLAIWLSDDKTNRDLIDLPDSPVEILIFKQAIATGWDCPRAQILVMFRDIKTPTFEIQTIGRILRMPKARHYDDENLNRAYIFTDLEKAEISIWETAKNLIKIKNSFRREDIFKKFYLNSFYKSRENYGDIGYSFYDILAKTLIDEINWSQEILHQMKNLELLAEKIDISGDDIKNNILSDWKMLVDIDEKSGEKIFSNINFEAKTSEELVKLSFDNFARNEVGPQFTNIARSYKSIIEALYFAFDNYFFGKKKQKFYYQKIVLNNKDFFVNLLNKAKENYLPVRKQEILQKWEKVEKVFQWQIPKFLQFTEKAEERDYVKNIFEPCFIEEDSLQEKYFMEQFLEKSEIVDFWFKNGTNSEIFFAIPYENDAWEKRSFYPDFIVYFKNWTIWIFDTKSGFTLVEWKNKAKWLEKFIRENIKNWKKIVGWLIECIHSENTDYFTFRINKTSDFNVNNRIDFDIFNNDFVLNYKFENFSDFSPNYKNDLEKIIDEKEEELEKLQESYKIFLAEQKNSWDFDFVKRKEILWEIKKIEKNIWNLKKQAIKMI